MKTNLCYLAVLFLLISCNERYEKLPAADTTPVAVLEAALDSVAQQPEKLSDSIPGATYTEVEWAEPKASGGDKKVIGQWIAATNEMGIKTGGVMMNLSQTGSDDLVERIMKSMEDKNYAKKNCVWLHFYKDHTGFYSMCADMGSGFSELNAIDIFNNNEAISMGLFFQWNYTGGKVRIRFDDYVKVPFVKDKKYKGDLKVKYWDLTILKSGSDGYYTVKEYFPEYEYTLPVKNDYLREDDPSEQVQRDHYRKAMLD